MSNDNGSFTFCVEVFFPLSFGRYLLDLTVYMNTTAGVLDEGWTIYPSRAPKFTSVFCAFFCGVRVTHLISLLCCHIKCLYVLRFELWRPLRFPQLKRCSFRIYFQLFVGGLMSYLRYLCLISCSFVFFVLFVLVLCALCCQFLWLSISGRPFGVL
jgi:hypothetical protein